MGEPSNSRSGGAGSLAHHKGTSETRAPRHNQQLVPGGLKVQCVVLSACPALFSERFTCANSFISLENPRR